MLPGSSLTPLEKHRGIHLGLGLRGAAGGEAVEDGSYYVHLGDCLRLEWCYPQATPPGIADKPLLLEQPQRLQDGLARDAERGGQLLLREPRAGGQFPVTDSVQQPLVHLLGQIGSGSNPAQGYHRARPRVRNKGKQYEYFVYRIQNTIL